MSFREKTHWVAFLALIIAFGWYFGSLPWAQIGSPQAVHSATGRMILVLIIFLVPMIAATAWFAVRAPQDANLQEDERERMIHRRGTHIAYYPLVLGIWANIFLMFGGLSGGLAVNILIATLVAGELIRVGSQLYYYRRGC